MMHLTRWPWFERFFLLVALSDNLLISIDRQLGWGVTRITDFCFAGLYTIEVFIKIGAWGLFGGKLSYFNANVFNRIDMIVTLFAWVEVIAALFNFTFTLRSLKLFRLLKPLISFLFFSGLEAIMKTMEVRAEFVCI
jgi:hypothetical protein